MSADTTPIALGWPVGLPCRRAQCVGLVIQCDLGLAGGRLNRCAGRPWHRGVDLGAAVRSSLHPPHTRDNPGFGDRSFYSLVVDCAGPFGDLRGRGTRASDGADHLLEFRIEADEVRAAAAAFPIDQDNGGRAQCTTLTM
jgi:hypothetical protein